VDGYALKSGPRTATLIDIALRYMRDVTLAAAQPVRSPDPILVLSAPEPSATFTTGRHPPAGLIVHVKPEPWRICHGFGMSSMLGRFLEVAVEEKPAGP
jgi:hypothetical protein